MSADDETYNLRNVISETRVNEMRGMSLRALGYPDNIRARHRRDQNIKQNRYEMDSLTATKWSQRTLPV